VSVVELFWLPLGAGGHFVKHNGRAFEAIAARRARRPVRDLYHSALRVVVSEGAYVIEMAPVVGAPAADRGVVAVGPVGLRAAGRLRLFRYEVRRWAGGFIPDADEAVDSPHPLTGDAATARRILDLVPRVPTPVWGRDELRTGDMWNSNSLISWLIVRGGLNVDAVGMPATGRAPGWDAGVVVARRQRA
jgi:hypothetical protein